MQLVAISHADAGLMGASYKVHVPPFPGTSEIWLLTKTRRANPVPAA